jgi:hypothetical protein
MFVLQDRFDSEVWEDSDYFNLVKQRRLVSESGPQILRLLNALVAMHRIDIDHTLPVFAEQPSDEELIFARDCVTQGKHLNEASIGRYLGELAEFNQPETNSGAEAMK